MLDKGQIKLFSGNAHRKLAEAICKELNVPCGNCEVGKFSDGEIFVNIAETVRGCDVFIIQPTSSPVNDNLMEALILIDALKRASAGRINAVIPYYGYARQDRKTKAREPITAKLVANLLTEAGTDRVISMDLHAGQIQGYFDIPVDHLSGIPILADYFKDLIDEDTVVVSPDIGGVVRARNFASILDLPIAIIEKRRPKANVSEVMNVIGDIKDKNVILVDDIVDTAGTITKAAEVLKNIGAKHVYACATHAVLSGPAIERIDNSVIEKFIVTDTIPLSDEKKIDKIEVVSVAPIFAEAIRRIHLDESVSILLTKIGSDRLFAVVGLGNPGKAYEGTRHNVGFDVIDLLANRNNIKINKIKFKSIYGEGNIGDNKVILLKPQTYMNNSGMAVLDLYNFYKLPVENIIVVVDDIDIQFATIRIRAKGSAGTHNGMKSIIYHLQSDNFPRVRIGIGQKREGQDLADFVLSKFSRDEREKIDLAIEEAALAVEAIIKDGIQSAMNQFNSRVKKPRSKLLGLRSYSRRVGIMHNMIIDPLKNMSFYKQLIEDIRDFKSPISVSGLMDENIGHIAYALNQHLNRSILIIVHSEIKAKKIYDDIKNFDEGAVELLSDKEIIFYKVDAISSERSINRLRVLSRLIKGEPIVVVAHVDAILNKFIAPHIFKEYSLNLSQGDVVDLKDLAQRLTVMGYKRENMVEAVGQFSIRGGIIDFFPPNSENPYRIELFDDEIDSIRTFDTESQRSIEMVQSVYIPPVKEMLILEDYKRKVIENIKEELNAVVRNEKMDSKIKANLEDKFGEYIEEIEENIYVSNMDMVIPYIPQEYVSSILDYFDHNSLVFIDEPKRIEERAESLKEQFLMRYSDVLEMGEVLPGHKNINYEYKDLVDKIKKKICILNTTIAKIDTKFNPVSAIKFATKSMQSFHNNMDLLSKELNYYKYRGYKVIIFSGSEDRGKNLQSTLMDLGTICEYSQDLDKEIKSSQVFIVPGSIHGGFEYTDIKLALISDKDIYGSIKEIRKVKKKSSKESVSFSDLNIGDYVVHENHGIGQYAGVEQLNIQGVVKDYLVIKYKDNDRLYVPIDQMNLIQKYIGGESVKPKINRLSSPEWVKVKQRAKKAVEDMAKDLLELYAKRQTIKGFAFSKDTIWQKQFEDAFPYEETEAQLRSIQEIKKDMEKDKPMDRLLCGDVGYGKTEVALRAAFKAIMDGKQVAFLVPTTILAQQHYNTIIERFSNFPINVEVLSRFKSPKEQKSIVERLGKGLVDLVVGTHRLLSKDVKFKDLGLLIIDEEQRFGVKHKEALKKIKENVDVLTLTATPIPRTLHMSLIGVRDMSVIDEPPGQRYPIETYVVEFNEMMIREAILKELNRGGQVYFVYNRVETIDKMASQLRRLVPEADIVIAHGQMSEKELERIMMDFISQKYNVLVCTTIIETGLDIPNVNTIIVYDADKMGLSQLYQLRGRVGRTNRIAYAYFTYEKNKVLTEVAEKRLKAIKDFTEFGSGFKIAMRDLEIRGTGNLLGVEQHGHIESIGYDLYVKFLNQAIRKLKGETVKETVDTTIDLSVDGYIPIKYIEDEEQKIEIYKKIAAVKDNKDYSELVDELVDRFGDIPKEVENLLDISYIKNNASECYIQNITQSNRVITLEFNSQEHISPDLIHYLSKKYGNSIGFDLSRTPSFRYTYKKNLLAELKDVINSIRNFFNED